MASSFKIVKCKCENEQIIFSHASQRVKCNKCGNILAEPTGGKAVILGKEIKNLG
jgi:small subunit ribosomal protein S27e